MKKIIASVGFAALGVSALHAQYSPGVTPEELSNPRGWSVAASLRGFYDDNPFTLPNNVARSTYGDGHQPFRGVQPHLREYSRHPELRI